MCRAGAMNLEPFSELAETILKHWKPDEFNKNILLLQQIHDEPS